MRGKNKNGEEHENYEKGKELDLRPTTEDRAVPEGHI